MPHEHELDRRLVRVERLAREFGDLPLLERDLAGSLSFKNKRVPFDVFNDRPSSDFVLSQFWPKLDKELLDLGAALELASALTGRDLVWRTGGAAGELDRRNFQVIFVGPLTASSWRERLLVAEEVEPNPWLLSLYTYAEVILSHPLRDGNGRLARALLLACLARRRGLSGPLIPLGPLVYANARVVDDAVLKVGLVGDWARFASVMSLLLRKALSYTESRLLVRADRLNSNPSKG